MVNRLAGKVIIATGAGSGIGCVTAIRVRQGGAPWATCVDVMREAVEKTGAGARQRPWPAAVPCRGPASVPGVHGCDRRALVLASTCFKNAGVKSPRACSS